MFCSEVVNYIKEAAKVFYQCATNEYIQENAIMASINVKVLKKPDDPIVPRVSMGGSNATGYYVIYRGNLLAIKEMFDVCHKQINAMVQEAPLTEI